MQIPRDIEKYSNDYLNSDYSFENILVKYRRKKVLECLWQYKPKNILEIGCGTDSISNYYTDFDTFTIVEPSVKFVSQAIRYENPDIKIYTDILENKVEDLKQKKYDFIILSSLLHEVINPDSFLAAVITLCNKETILHINVPNSKSFHRLWAYESSLINELDNLSETAIKLQQNTTFDLNKLIETAELHKLKILDKGSYFIKPFNHSKMQKCIDDKLINNSLLDGLQKLTKYMPELGAEIYINCRLK